MKIAKHQDNTVILENMQSKLNNLCYKSRFLNDLCQKELYFLVQMTVSVI